GAGAQCRGGKNEGPLQAAARGTGSSGECTSRGAAGEAGAASQSRQPSRGGQIGPFRTRGSLQAAMPSGAWFWQPQAVSTGGCGRSLLLQPSACEPQQGRAFAPARAVSRAAQQEGRACVRPAFAEQQPAVLL